MEIKFTGYKNSYKNRVRRPFLERVATFDFDKHYTRKIRFIAHLSMWLFFTLLILLTLFFDSNLPFVLSLVIAARSLLCNMAVFYLFFYIIVPNTLLKNRAILAILSIPTSIILWIILNHYCLFFIGKHFNVEAPYYKTGIESNLRQNFYDVLSPANILLNLIPFFYSVSAFFFIKIVFDIIRFYSKWFKSERKAVQLEVEKLNLERDFLKAQLNPHFLFNTLNNLYGLSLRGDEQTPQVITQLSEMMRYTLYESNAEKVQVFKELQYLKNYVLLEKMRYKDNVDIAYEIDDSNAGDLLIAPLLTFTFIENGFKYGLSKKNEGFLKINISIERNFFYFSIINDKYEKSKPGKFGGIGLENARKRLGLLYPNKHTLTIEDGDKTFYVALIINLQ